MSLSLILLCPSRAVATEPASTSADAFARLRSLVGTWKGTFEDGRPHSVNYGLTAGVMVLVETWTLGAARESLTPYPLVGDALVATHYCPQGNQARLDLARNPGSPERLSFVFRDGGNLQVQGKSHQHAFWIELNRSDVFVRSETYVENGSTAKSIANADADAAVTYTRSGLGQ